MLFAIWSKKELTSRGHLEKTESEKRNLFRILYCRAQYSEKPHIHLKTSTALIDTSHDFQMI
jgi:hypothetical protein